MSIRSKAITSKGVFLSATTAFFFLFIALSFVTQAEAAAFPASTGTFLKSMTLRLWVTQNDVVLTTPIVVSVGNDFTINWEAVGKNVSNEPTTAGITCQNNWNDKTAASGSDTGSLIAKRTFLITCAGLGTGRIAAATVAVAAPDLVPGRFSLSELVRSSTTTTTAFLSGARNQGLFKLSILNLGPATVVRPFKVGVDYSTDRTFASINKFTLYGTPIEVNGIGRALSATSPFVKPLAEFRSYIGTPGLNYFRMCVDIENVVRESNENNNCVIKGPLLFVTE